MSIRDLGLLFLLSSLPCACSAKHDEPEAKPPAVAPLTGAQAARVGPRFVAGALPVAPFVAEQLLDSASGSRTVVYAGASWCEPCQYFHRAVEAGELDAVLPGVRFVEYDYDVAKEALAEAGYASRLIPLFALPDRDGRATGPIVAGSIKGEGAVQNLVPRLQALLAGEASP